jgi:site-specific DNA recombinase
VWARVRQVLTRPDIIAQELERLREQDPGVVNLAAIDEQIGKLQAKRDRLTRRLAMIEDDELAQSVVRDAEALSQEIRSLQADREAITRRRTEWQKVQTNLESLRAWCRKVADKVDSLTYAEKRLALDALAVQVTLWRADHERRYDIDMTVDLDSEIVSTTSLTTGTTTPGCAGSVWGITTRSAMPTPGTPGAWP